VGYKGNGSICTEIDGCAGDPCGDNAVCRQNGPGNHICTCDPNFVANGPLCVPVKDHTIEEQIDAAQKAIADLQQIEDQKSQYVQDLGRQQKLEELEARVAELNKDKREREDAEEQHQLDHVEHRVEDVEQTTQEIAHTAQKQARLIQELKIARQSSLARRQAAVETEAKRIFDLAKAAANSFSPPPAQPQSGPFPRSHYTPATPPNENVMIQQTNQPNQPTTGASRSPSPSPPISPSQPKRPNLIVPELDRRGFTPEIDTSFEAAHIIGTQIHQNHPGDMPHTDQFVVHLTT